MLKDSFMIKFCGKIDNFVDLDAGTLPASAVQFKEPKTTLALNVLATVHVFPVLVFGALAIAWKNYATGVSLSFSWDNVLISCMIAAASVVPHEILHAGFYPRNATIGVYYNLRNLMVFIYTTYPLSADRFIVMSLAPALLLGGIPLLVSLLIPGGLGEIMLFVAILNLCACGGDFINVCNTLRQVPRNAFVQNSGFHSYWYMEN
jgi:hypothetical protein